MHRDIAKYVFHVYRFLSIKFNVMSANVTTKATSSNLLTQEELKQGSF